MRKHLLLMAVLFAFALSNTAFAQGKGKGQGQAKGNSANTKQSVDQGNAKAKQSKAKHDDDDKNWEVRNGFQYRTYEGDSRPPGWNKGKKTGWGNCDVPPGHAKKGGCYTYLYQGRRYYWYHDDVGRIIVRRPVIRAGVEIGF